MVDIKLLVTPREDDVNDDIKNIVPVLYKFPTIDDVYAIVLGNNVLNVVSYSVLT